MHDEYQIRSKATIMLVLLMSLNHHPKQYHKAHNIFLSNKYVKVASTLLTPNDEILIFLFVLSLKPKSFHHLKTKHTYLAHLETHNNVLP